MALAIPKIIISYRRSDSNAVAGRIRDRLANYYGEESIFMDIDSIPFGIDFREHIKSALQDGILVVVVGPNWVGSGKGGRTRIKEETDPVRIEVEIALKRGIAVIPVVIDDATMPNPAELPENLKNFAYLNAAPVDSGRDFHQHMDRLIRSMDRIIAGKGEPAAKDPSPSDHAKSQSKKSAAANPAPGTAVKSTPELPMVNGPAVTPGPPSSAIAESSAPDTVEASTEDATQDIAVSKPATTAGLPLSALTDHPTPAAASLLRTREDESTRRTSKIPTGPMMVAAVVALCALLLGVVWMLSGAATKQVTPAQTPRQQQADEQPQRQTLQPVAAPSCKPGSTATLQDDFQAARPGWDLSQLIMGSRAYYADGQMVLRAAERTSMAVLYTSLMFKNQTVCVHIKSPRDERTLATTGGGVIFWAKDGYNYYVASVHPDGSYGIYRYASMSGNVITPRTRFDSIKPGLGIVNEVLVTTNQNKATLYINNAKVQEFQGEPPENGGAVGLWVHSQEDQPSEWRFLDIVVVENK